MKNDRKRHHYTAEIYFSLNKSTQNFFYNLVHLNQKKSFLYKQLNLTRKKKTILFIFIRSISCLESPTHFDFLASNASSIKTN